jgi:hypothetical protein
VRISRRSLPDTKRRVCVGGKVRQGPFRGAEGASSAAAAAVLQYALLEVDASQIVLQVGIRVRSQPSEKFGPLPWGLWRVVAAPGLPPGQLTAQIPCMDGSLFGAQGAGFLAGC